MAILAVLRPYLILMTFIVHWYGDLPDQTAFYLVRSTHGWAALEVAGVTIGAAGLLSGSRPEGGANRLA